MKKRFSLIIILSAFLGIAASANAAQIKSAQLYSEYRTYSTPFTYDDQYFMQAFAFVDVEKTVYLQGVPGSTGDEPLICTPGWSNPPASYEYDKYFTTVDGYPSPGSAWEGRNYNFYIEGNLDNKSCYIPSGSINQMGVPSSVTISGGFNPTITWNAVDGAEFYRARFFPIGPDGNPDRSVFLDGSPHIYTDGSSTYSYQYMGDAFDEYGTLAVAVETNDVSDGGQWLNRSVHYSQHNPAPEPATIGDVCIASEYRHYQAPFTKTDTYSMLAWAIVDNNIYDVYLQNVPDSSGDILLNPVPLWDDFTPYQFAKGFSSPSPGAAWEGFDYNFYIEGHLDDKTWNIPQGSIQQIGYPSTVTIIGGIHPTITWNKVAGADWYRVRIFPIVDGNPNRGDLLDQSGNITDDGSLSYSYNYTGDAFESYGTLAVAIETYDDAGVSSLWVNRSVHYSQHNPVPVVYIAPDGLCDSHTPCYSRIQDGINWDGSVFVIKAEQGIYDENIVFDESKQISLQGGWDQTFMTQPSYTTIKSMRINDGTVAVDKLVIQ